MNWQHIIPRNDDKEHTESLDCPCEPCINWDYMLVIHKAWDFREVREKLNE